MGPRIVSGLSMRRVTEMKLRIFIAVGDGSRIFKRNEHNVQTHCNVKK